MSTRNHKAIFEDQPSPLDTFTGELGTPEVVCQEFVSLEPQGIASQRGEFTDATQTTSTRKSIATAIYSTTLAGVTTKHRMKIRRSVIVNEEQPESDDNYRIFQIEQIVNVKEQNRELQFLVIERQ